MMNPDPAQHYLEDAIVQFRQLKLMGERALDQLDDAQLFLAPDPESNSLAVIVKHLAGNMRSRWRDFLTTDGEKPDRHRDQEFIVDSSTTRAELLRWWEAGWSDLFGALETLTPGDLMRQVTIRHQPHTVIQAINRQLTHYANHVGQIVFLAKHLKSTEWISLSVPRGQSEELNRKMSEQSKE